MARVRGSRASQFPRESCHNNAYCLPSVNQMMTAGGAGYNDPKTMPRMFPASPMSRLQTPVNNVGAFLQRYTRVTANMVHRGIMWCR